MAGLFGKLRKVRGKTFGAGFSTGFRKGAGSRVAEHLQSRKDEEDQSNILSSVFDVVSNIGIGSGGGDVSGLLPTLTEAGPVAEVIGAGAGAGAGVGAAGAGTAAGAGAAGAGAAGAAGGLAAAAPLLAACWVADELYGPQAKRTHLARLYAQTNDTWFLRKYKKHGVQWAKWLKHHSWAKPLVRPIWDCMAFKGALIAARWEDARNG